jgi:DNA-directed RNA polymerase specialized sigma24 family protein
MVMNPDLTDGASQKARFLWGRRSGDPHARNGDNPARDALVERYAPQIWSICRRHGPGGADTRDVGQNVWLKPVDQLETSTLHRRMPRSAPG